MVGDTDPPKCSVYRPISQVLSRTYPVGVKGEFSAAPAPGRAQKETPATAATGAGVTISNSVAAYGTSYTTSLSARAIAKMLGGVIANASSVLVPGPGHSPHDRSLHVTFHPDGTFSVHSYSGDDWRTCKDYVATRLGIAPVTPFRPREVPYVPAKAGTSTEVAEPPSLDHALNIWREARPADPVLMRYLASRGLDGLLPLPEVIRFHPACPFGRGLSVPAMVALFRDIATDVPCGIHRTALRPDGSGKAVMPDGGAAKRMLGRAKGAAIKLTPDDEVTTGLAIAEGIETGLSVLLSGLRPVWALGSAGAVERFPVLPGIDAIALMADHDPAGIAAARACASRWAAEGREALITHPPKPGTDWNDSQREGLQ